MTIHDSDKMNSARDAISRGDKQTAQRILANILNHDSQNIEAWLLLADILENPNQRIESLQRVLRINPENVIAKRRLGDLARPPNPNPNLASVVSRNPPKTRSNKNSVLVLIVGLIAVCGCVGVIYLLTTTTNNANTPSKPTGTEASIICEQFVNNRLKAPSTAKFSSYDEDRIYTLTDKVNGYRVVGWVDAQNSFGAQLRSQYNCEIQYNGGDWADITNWTLLYLDIQ